MHSHTRIRTDRLAVCHARIDSNAHRPAGFQPHEMTHVPRRRVLSKHHFPTRVTRKLWSAFSDTVPVRNVMMQSGHQRPCVLVQRPCVLVQRPSVLVQRPCVIVQCMYALMQQDLVTHTCTPENTHTHTHAEQALVTHRQKNDRRQTHLPPVCVCAHTLTHILSTHTDKARVCLYIHCVCMQSSPHTLSAAHTHTHTLSLSRACTHATQHGLTQSRPETSASQSSNKDSSPPTERGRPHSALGRMSSEGGSLSGGALRVDPHAHAERGRPVSATPGDPACACMYVGQIVHMYVCLGSVEAMCR
jgi:hypothetical protein